MEFFTYSTILVATIILNILLLVVLFALFLIACIFEP